MSTNEAINEVMEVIDDNKYAKGEVSPADSIEFFQGIVDGCQVRLDAIRDEHGEHGEGNVEDIDTDDVDDE